MNTNRIDWLRGTFPAPMMNHVEGIVKQYFGDSVKGDRPFLVYEQARAWGNGTFIAYYSSDDLKMYDACLSLPGSALATLTVEQTHKLLRSLALIGFHASRIDCTHDDTAKHIHPSALTALLRQNVQAEINLHVRGFQYSRCISSSKKNDDKGSTVEFGRRGQNGSGKFLRVYDKDQESNHEINAIRWEMEFTGDWADHVYRTLAAADPITMPRLIGQAIGGVVDFYTKNSPTERHISRMTPLPWWTRLKKQLEATNYSLPAKEPTPFERTAEWLNTAIGKPLAKLRLYINAHGGDKQTTLEWLKVIIYNGDQKLTDNERAEAIHGTLHPVLLHGVLPAAAAAEPRTAGGEQLLATSPPN